MARPKSTRSSTSSTANLGFEATLVKAEDKNGGQFCTPICVVHSLVEMLAPYKGRIYDPACDSGGMFLQSERIVESHSGKLGDIGIYGPESNATTGRLAVMKFALRKSSVRSDRNQFR